MKLRRLVAAALCLLPSLAFAQAALPPTVPAPKLQIVGTRGQILGQSAAGGGGANNYTRSETRLFSVLGCAPVSGLRLAVGNYAVGGGTGEAANANAITVEAAIENPTPAQTWPLTFGGAPSVTLAAGAAGTLSDPLGVDLPALGGVWLRMGVTVTSGQVWARGSNPSRSGENSYESTSATSQIGNTGGLTGGTTSLPGYAPLAVLGIPQRATPAVIILGDSIAYGVGEASTIGDGLGNRGFAQRGLANVNGCQIPWANEARASDAASVNQTTNLGWRKRYLWQYASDLLVNLGTNDIAVGNSLATVQGNLINIWQGAKRSGLRVHQVLIMPRMKATTDSYATPGGMTPETGFEVGGVRDQLNAWIKAQVATGLIDSFIDVNKYVEDQANPSKWITNGTANYPTADGVHPSTPLHILAAQPVNADAVTWRPRP